MSATIIDISKASFLYASKYPIQNAGFSFIIKFLGFNVSELGISRWINETYQDLFLWFFSRFH